MINSDEPVPVTLLKTRIKNRGANSQKYKNLNKIQKNGEFSLTGREVLIKGGRNENKVYHFISYNYF